MPANLPALNRRRRLLLRQLAELGDLHRGSLTRLRRRCGRVNCQCARAGGRPHGPHYLLTWKENGRGRSRSVRPGADLARVREHLANHRRFRRLMQRLVETHEAICRQRSR